MSRADDVAMYATDVRTKLARPLTEEEVELMRDLYDDDVTAEAVALRIENATEAAGVRRAEQRAEHPEGEYPVWYVREMTEAGRSHLLRNG